MKTDVAWEVDDRPLSDRAVRTTLEAALELGGRPGAWLGVVFVDDATLAALHARHLGDPTPTDVLAFDLGEEGEGPVGELYVSVERARAVAAARGIPAGRELALYLVHGALHLCGFDDHDDDGRARMREAETRILERLGYPPDPLPHDRTP